MALVAGSGRHGASRHLVAMTDVPNLKADEVAAAQLAVDTQVEEGLRPVYLPDTIRKHGFSIERPTMPA
jgi:hypothetical protein